MSLVDVDWDSDPWLREKESCERLYREIVEQFDQRTSYPKNSETYLSISGSIRIRLKQYAAEVSQLRERLNDSKNPFTSTNTDLTDEERERRGRIVETLQSKSVQLQQRLDESTRAGASAAASDRSQLLSTRGRGGGAGWPLDEEEVTRPLLTDDRELTVQELREHQSRVIAEQDRGLENLSSIISRQKEISIKINNEVDLQNDLVDDIGNRMERTDTNVRSETDHVKVVTVKDSTCGYWVVIILLLVAIVSVLVIP